MSQNPAFQIFTELLHNIGRETIAIPCGFGQKRLKMLPHNPVQDCLRRIVGLVF